MPWHKFKAGPTDVRQVLTFIFEETDCVLLETYSAIDQDLREFTALADVEAAFMLGIVPEGSTLAQQFSLWSPSVMPRPTLRTIMLKRPAGRIRHVVEGCGLFQLHLGGKLDGEVIGSALGYWTEAGAKQRCMVVPGPERVNWLAHRTLAEKLKYHVTKRLNTA
jgi:hypothetical protein